MVDCDKFVLDRCTLDGPLTIGGDQRFHLLVSIAGSAAIEGDPAGHPLSQGQTCLLPATADAVRLTPQGRAVVLDIYLP